MNSISSPGLSPAVGSQLGEGGHKGGVVAGKLSPGQTALAEPLYTIVDSSATLSEAAKDISRFMGQFRADLLDGKRLTDLKMHTEGEADRPDREAALSFLAGAKVLTDPQALEQTIRALQSTTGNLREFARQHSQDPATQYMLLMLALLEGQEQGLSDDALEGLREAVADLELSAGPQIRASLNTVSVASEYGANAAEVAVFQGAYQDLVLGESSLSRTFSALIERLGGAQGDDLQRGLQGMVAALGADIAASRPSTDPRRLQSLIQDLYHLQVATTVLDGARDLAATLQARNQSGSALRPVELMKEMVTLSGEKWVASQRFTQLAERFDLQQTEGKITFQTAVKGMLQQLPVQVFSDSEARQAVLSAAQEALDQAIDEEDA